MPNGNTRIETFVDNKKTAPSDLSLAFQTLLDRAFALSFGTQ